VRLSVVDGERLTWVARAQGARQGLRYDPDMGSDARLSCSSSGWAWLSSMKDDEAMGLLAKQGLGAVEDFGPNAPTSLQAVMTQVQQARERGYAVTVDTYSLGLSAISAPVCLGGQSAMGVLTLAGPTVRFTQERMLALASELLSVAAQLAATSGASPFFAQNSAASNGASAGRKPIYAP
jgi:IclR family acetate operon transcriptional repressor